MYLPLFTHWKEAIHRAATAELLILRDNQLTSTTMSTTTTTQHQLSNQWTNPNDVLSVLLIVGGDIVQKALAQTAGGYFTPVCFSFGWVSYSLNALISIIGDGRLLPEPDHPVKVYNLQNGYVRDNKNWLIGRILRDNIMGLNKTDPLQGNAMRISVYDALQNKTDPSVAGSGRVRGFGIAVMLLQLGIAAVPMALHGEWGIVLVTGIGTVLALVAGALPQWRVEKHPAQARSRKNFALTSGNGARDIMVIRGNGACLDLEEIAAAQMPRSERIWEAHPLLSKQLVEAGKPKTHGNGSPYRVTWVYRGIPLGFWITMGVVTCQFVLWLALLITVAGLRAHVWYLLVVGALGMLQNVIVAASSREPEKRGLRLRPVEVILSRKVMDGLMDLEVTYSGFGDVLRNEFFPGKLDDEEIKWWDGDTEPYDTVRQQQIERRGRPRRYLPKYTESLGSSQQSEEKPVPYPGPVSTLSTRRNSKRRSARRRSASIPSLVLERSVSPEVDAVVTLPSPTIDMVDDSPPKAVPTGEDSQGPVDDDGHSRSMVSDTTSEMSAELVSGGILDSWSRSTDSLPVPHMAGGQRLELRDLFPARDFPR